MVCCCPYNWINLLCIVLYENLCILFQFCFFHWEKTNHYLKRVFLVFKCSLMLYYYVNLRESLCSTGPCCWMENQQICRIYMTAVDCCRDGFDWQFWCFCKQLLKVLGRKTLKNTQSCHGIMVVTTAQLHPTKPELKVQYRFKSCPWHVRYLQVRDLQ